MLGASGAQLGLQGDIEAQHWHGLVGRSGGPLLLTPVHTPVPASIRAEGFAFPPPEPDFHYRVWRAVRELQVGPGQVPDWSVHRCPEPWTVTRHRFSWTVRLQLDFHP